MMILSWIWPDAFVVITEILLIDWLEEEGWWDEDVDDPSVTVEDEDELADAWYNGSLLFFSRWLADLAQLTTVTELVAPTPVVVLVVVDAIMREAGDWLVELDADSYPVDVEEVDDELEEDEEEL